MTTKRICNGCGREISKDEEYLRVWSAVYKDDIIASDDTDKIQVDLCDVCLDRMAYILEHFDEVVKLAERIEKEQKEDE